MQTTYQKLWYEQNRERILAKLRERRKDPKIAKAKYEENKKWIAEHPEENRAYKRKWAKQYRDENKELCLKKEAEYRNKNRDRVNAAVKLYRIRNLETVKAKQRETAKQALIELKNDPEAYAAYLAKKRAYAAEYRAKNRTSLAAYHRVRYHQDVALARKQRNELRKKSHTFKASRERYYSDPIKRIIKSLYHTVRKCLAGKIKSNRTMALIGCTPNELKAHIEAQFQPGMDWTNYGKDEGCWSIDHILPCASFRLWEPSEQKKCFNYTNLRPLWFTMNCAKNSIVDGVKYWHQVSPAIPPCNPDKPS